MYKGWITPKVIHIYYFLTDKKNNIALHEAYYSPYNEEFANIITGK